MALYRNGRLAEAERACRQILAGNPKSADAYHLLGSIAHRTGQKDVASELTRKAIRINPELAGTHVKFGTKFHRQGRLEEAIRCYRNAVALTPDFLDAHYHLANALFERGRLAEAAESYRTCLRLQPNFAEAFCRLGRTLQALENHKEAAAAYRQALTLHPDHAATYSNLGNALRKENKLAEALACQQKALSLRPDSAEIHCNLGIVLQEAGDLEGAASCYRQALSIKPDFATAYCELGKLLRETGRQQEAASAFRQALTQRPDYLEAYCQLGKTLKTRKLLDEANDCYQQALAVDPECFDALTGYGRLLLEQGKLEEAAAVAESCRRRRDLTTFQHYSLGFLLAKCNLKEEARTHFEIVLEREPDDPRGARLLLAGLGFAPLPGRASGEQLRRFYAKRAHTWGQSETYRAHKAVAVAFEKRFSPAADLALLDAGCGNGLIGLLVAGSNRQVDGVDLSKEMLQEARSRGIYSHLHQGDLVSFMAERPARYHAVLSAATLIHFGNLRPVFEAAATTLVDHGVFIFTLFPNEEEGQDVAVASLKGFAQGGCFFHSKGYVRRQAAAAGFSVELLEEHVHEYDQSGDPIMGMVVTLRRQASVQPF
ncbi:MAG: tetratricopeptide repeat protein [Deltaproteobacteria bacterium]